jgi:hypothetical protein
LFKQTREVVVAKSTALATIFFLTIFVLPVYGVEWTESPDAGDLTGTAQVTSGPANEPLTAIYGTIANTQDVDLYKIRIASPSTFSATTSGGDAAPFDAVMALFDAQGLGVYLNDDGAFDVGDPSLPAGHPLGPSAPGTYYLAIFSDRTLPFSGAGASVNDLIFPVPQPPYTEVLGPTGGGGTAPLSGWATEAVFGLNAGYQIFLSGAETAESLPSPDLVNISGTVQTAGGTGLRAMVLASGRFMFSCNPNGPFALTDLPRENDGTVKRQIYVDGFFPNIDVLPGSVEETVTMVRAGTCPSYNPPYEPGVFPGAAGRRIDISGRVLLQDTQTPICAMVLANGQFMFSCDGTGSYALNIPLDSNGQFKLQIYADGFAPTILRFDEFQANNDVRMALWSASSASLNFRHFLCVN